MPRNRESALQTKVIQAVFGLVFFGIVLFVTKGMMFGSTKIAKIFAAGIVGMTLVFALDQRYWLLSGFLFGFYDTIPYVKFTGAELGALLLVSIFFVRMSLRRDASVGRINSVLLAALPFMAWMCLVWSMNPTGLFVFGSSSIGGRYYFKVILAFMSMFCLSSMRFSENDCKLLGYSICAGYLAFTICAFVFGDIQESLAGSGVHYDFIHLSFVAPIFLCRFSAPELFTRFWPFWGFLTTFGLSFYSGNRTAAARPVLVGLMAPFFLKRDRGRTVVLFGCALVVLFVIVAGQGTVWRLPFAIQRPLSFLPGKWDQRLEAYGFNDDFRAELRFWARQHIKENPWFGDGGFSLDYGDMAWTSYNKNQEAINFHVLARNWHNVWLGMAADFGIPLSVAWALFMLVLMVSGYSGTRRLPPGSWWQTMYLYCYLLVLTDFVNSFFQGGHSSLTAQQFFLWAGLMMAVLNGVDASVRQGATRA